MPAGDRPPRAVTATRAIAGHFGEFVQGRLGTNGPVVLVTLAAPDLRVSARYIPAGPFTLHCLGGERPLAPAQAAALLRALDGKQARGRLTLRSDTPAGGGAGSSTASLVAASAAFAAARRQPLPDPRRLARLCLAIEGATDPLMYPEPGQLLWASRHAWALAALPPPPRLEIVGGFLGPGLRTDPADDGFADVADLVAAWPAAAARGDAAALAGLATESARRNMQARGGPDPAPLLAAAAQFGALGIVVAHTGSARGLIFSPGLGDPEGAALALRAVGVRSVRRFRSARDMPTRKVPTGQRLEAGVA